MKTFNEWLKEIHHCEMPKGTVSADWFFERGIPMIVECRCCTTTLAIPNAYIDDEGYTYCKTCGRDD